MDQATQLRNLAQVARQRESRSLAAPRTLAIVGGKGGVGVTTLAVNLAVAGGARGARMALLEAGADRADIAPLCGLGDGFALDEVLRAHRTLPETLQQAGMNVVVAGGAWASRSTCDYGPTARERLIKQITDLGEEADQVLLDIATGSEPLAAQIWQAADEAIVVTTPDDLAVMDAYAAIKRLGNWPETIWLVVNQCPDRAQAEDVFHRIDRSCRRFLGFGLEMAGDVPSDPAVGQAAERRIPLLRHAPESAAALAIDYLATVLSRKAAEPGREA